MRVPQDDTDLRGRSTLPGELADVVGDLIGRGLEPRGGVPRVRDRRRRDTLALAVKSTHFVVWRSKTAAVVGAGCSRALVDVWRKSSEDSRLVVKIGLSGVVEDW